MLDSQGRDVVYRLEPSATPRAIVPANDHLLLIGAICFAIGWAFMAAVLRHTR